MTSRPVDVGRIRYWLWRVRYRWVRNRDAFWNWTFVVLAGALMGLMLVAGWGWSFR